MKKISCQVHDLPDPSPHEKYKVAPSPVSWEMELQDNWEDVLSEVKYVFYLLLLFTVFSS